MTASLPPNLIGYGQSQGIVYQRRPTIDELMTPRRQHIPTWYTGHHDLDAFVLWQDGTAFPAEFDGEPFRIGEIPVERRWVIGRYDRASRVWTPSNRLMPVEDYFHLHQQWVMEFYRLIKEKRGIDAIQFEGRIEAEAIPDLRVFVLEMVDPMDETKTLPMHYSNETRGRKPAVLYDSKGESPRERSEVLLEAYRTMPEKLTEKERAEVESMLPPDDPMMRLTQLSGRLVRGEITAEEFASESRAIAGKAPVPEIQAAPSPPKRILTACGKKVWPSKLSEHMERCESCREGDGA